MNATLRPFSGAAPPRPLAMSAAIPRSIAGASRPRRLAMSTALPRPLAMSAELPSPVTAAARAGPLATRDEISDPGKARTPVMLRKHARSFTVHGVSNEAGGITEPREKSALLVEKEDESAQIQVNAGNGETSHDDTKSSVVGNSLEPKMNRPLEPKVNERKVLMINDDGEIIELDAIVYNQLTCTKHVLTETDYARLKSIVKSYTERSHRTEVDYSENLNDRTEIGAQEKERTDALLKRLHDTLKDTWINQLVLNRRLLLLALVGVGAGVYIHFKFKVLSAVKDDYLSLAVYMLFEFFGAKEIARSILKEQLKSNDISKKN